MSTEAYVNETAEKLIDARNLIRELVNCLRSVDESMASVWTGCVELNDGSIERVVFSSFNEAIENDARRIKFERIHSVPN